MMATNALGSEVGRIKAHLDRALAFARARDVTRLSRLQRIVRDLLLSELESYRNEGRFPCNHEHPGRMTPSFVDAHGTRCAMAHLLELGGGADLVREVSRSKNFAYVDELASDPALVAWLDAAGLTVTEAARIQPSYCSAQNSDCFCGSSWSSSQPTNAAPIGVIEVTTGRQIREEYGHPVYAARIDAVYGETPERSVGQELEITNVTGSSIFLPVYRRSVPASSSESADGGLGEIEIGTPVPWSGGIGTCKGDDFATKHAIAKADLVNVLMASDCRAAMGALDSAWNEESEKSIDCKESENGRGCSSSPESYAGEALTTAVFVALVGAIAMRRLRRATP